MKEIVDNLDEIQTQIEALEQNWYVEEYINLLKEKAEIIEIIKSAIKDWEQFEETKTLVFKKTPSFTYSPIKLKALIWWEKANQYIVLEEKINSDNIKKAIKLGKLPKEVESCKEIKSVAVKVIPKSQILTDIEL